MVQLPERARERRLAAVVRAGDDEDPLRLLEMEVVADDAAALAHELVRQREVEGGLGGDILRVARRRRG